MSETTPTTDELVTAKLNLETGVLSWKELELFFARGQLILVKSGADLVDAAKHFANDDKAMVQQLLDSATVRQPDLDWVKENCQSDTQFWAVVISPFVLIQKK
ncbi:DUF2288 family protein [Pleionea sp. CnH1-48]|uniref:DUF2288 family protein n=1 Tax=Pleionea sp. CnH1-48 TaxID=2954494 RepID=UPI002097E3EA|nr:DUF2288 family protein [Pleionea sp. CnH1-48]MCO7227252.1 DUF2288 domain-containing protein [Pleionea sp. CnH1-48]